MTDSLNLLVEECGAVKFTAYRSGTIPRSLSLSLSHLLLSFFLFFCLFLEQDIRVFEVGLLCECGRLCHKISTEKGKSGCSKMTRHGDFDWATIFEHLFECYLESSEGTHVKQAPMVTLVSTLYAS